MSVYSILLASGMGTRFASEGDHLPKQFLSVGEDPFFIMALKQFLPLQEIKAHIITVTQEKYNYALELLNPLQEDHNHIYLTIGDVDRQGSLLKGIYAIEKLFGIQKDDIVITHDAARPFVSKKIIQNTLQALCNSDCDGMTVAIPATDTLIRSFDGEAIHEVPVRKEFFQIQTPQAFKLPILFDLLEKEPLTERLSLTDVNQLFVNHHKKVGFIKGSSLNMKITHPEDIILMRGFFSSEPTNLTNH